MTTPATKAHHDELRNVCENYPVFAGNTISHKTARDICGYGWIERNKNGDWIPTGAGLAQYKEDLASGMWEAPQ